MTIQTNKLLFSTLRTSNQRKPGHRNASYIPRRDRQRVAAVGCAHAARWRHDGADPVPTHQPLDPLAACAASLGPQGGMRCPNLL